ncbi:MAG: DEAD/DEAH box helicase [Thermoplasmatota archaeon]
MNDFRSLGLSEKTLATLEKKGFTIPTDIQSLAIPLLIEDRKDIIAQAQTGTGKTAVFALPLIEKLEPGAAHVQAIVLAPTRELVIQVSKEIESLRGNSGIIISPIYGGQPIDIQFRKLKKGVDIVIGTPGRVLDHIRRRTLVIDKVRYFILDEADEMLNMGFIEDIEEIMGKTPSQKRVLLFSATMPGRILKLAENYMGEYTHIRSEPKLTTDLTEQIYFEVSQRDKFEALTRILEIESDFYGIIFCKTRSDVDELTNRLIDRGVKADNLHGDISQPLREKILGKFRDRKINILVATDVAARGIDVGNLTHVINYSIPQNPEAYVHRIGRTGRAGKKGTAITFVTPSELRKMNFIRKFIKADISKQRAPEKHEIVSIRKRRVEDDIEGMLSRKETEGYRKWAKELLEEGSGEDIITALLKFSFGKDLEEVHWKHGSGSPGGSPPGKVQMKTPGHPPEKKAEGEQDNIRTTRLMIAMGRKDRMNKGRILDMVHDKAGTPKERITDIEIMDDATLITVPSRDAKSILKFFRRSLKGKDPLIVKMDKGASSGTGRPKTAGKHKRKEKGRFLRD